jgi:hypothetical protein
MLRIKAMRKRLLWVGVFLCLAVVLVVTAVA